MSNQFKPGEWGIRNGKPVITWVRHGIASMGEPIFVTVVREYADEVTRFEAYASFKEFGREMNHIKTFEYQLLARLQQDCKYYLDAGQRQKNTFGLLKKSFKFKK